MRLRKTASNRTARPSTDDPRQLGLDDVLAASLLRRANEECERSDRRAAEDLWDQGALLNELADLTGDAAAIERSFADGAEAARERMQLARCTSRWLAGVYGLARLRLGLALMARCGVTTLDQLETVALPVSMADGSPARFPATRELLERALQQLDTQG